MLPAAQSNSDQILAVIPAIIDRQREFLEWIGGNLSCNLENVLHYGCLLKQDARKFFDDFYTAIEIYYEADYDVDCIDETNLIEAGRNFSAFLEFAAHVMRVTTQLFNDAVQSGNYGQAIKEFDRLTAPFEN